MAKHVFDLPATLRQMDRVSEVVCFREVTNHVQKLGRRILGKCGRREHADPPTPRTMPSREQIMGALPALISQPGREPRGFTAGKALRGQRPSTVFDVTNGLRKNPAQARVRQRLRRPADASRVFYDRGRPAPNGFQSTHHGHQRGLLLGKETARPDGEATAVGKTEVLVETVSERCRKMGVAVDEAREECLTPSIVDLGLGIRLEDSIGRADRCNPVALDRERDVFLHGICVHHGCMREDDGLPRRRLSLDAALIEKEGSGAGAGEQLTPGEVDRTTRRRRRRRRATNRGV